MSQLATGPAQGLDLEQFRPELTGYCYRMLGSTFDADDAVQDTLLRAWQAWDRFEGRSSVRSWIYRIATNVCLDRLRGRQRRILSLELAGPASPHLPATETLPGEAWIEPISDADVESASDPAAQVVRRDTIRLAFIAALQHLPPRQRAVLILREVLSWQAAEVADLLDTSVASVNSALQRARATLAASEVQEDAPVDPLGEEQKTLLARYVSAFESYDISSLVKLLRDDATFSMPPYAMWLRGHEDVSVWYLGHGIGCKGSRLIPMSMNGSPAFAQYKLNPAGDRRVPWSIQVVELSGDRIGHLHHFLDTTLFARFGLPAELDLNA
jgi:RNA polymerase sigma-70 factor, ECF subfamily